MVPEDGSEAYRETVRLFYSGIAAIQSGSDIGAEEKLQEASDLAPGEAAIQANLGLLALRQNEIDLADERLTAAAELAPQNSSIQLLLGLLEQTRSDDGAAVGRFSNALEFDPENIKALYARGTSLERMGESQQALADLASVVRQTEESNLASLLELLRLATDAGADAEFATGLAALRGLSGGWQDEVAEQFQALEATWDGDASAMGDEVAFLRNLLVRTPDFRQSLRVIQTPIEQVGDLMTRFVSMPSPAESPAPADLAMEFQPDTLNMGFAWDAVRAVTLAGEERPTIVALSATEVSLNTRLAYESGTDTRTVIDMKPGVVLNFPGGGVPPNEASLAAADFNYDFLTDLVVAGGGGLKIYRQDSAFQWIDETASSGLEPSVTGARYFGVWPADIDLEGDLDFVLAPESGGAFVIRNNGDGSFARMDPFPGLESVVDFQWGDIDGDGDPDGVFVLAGGTVKVLANERLARFTPQADQLFGATSTGLADLDGDMVLDVVALTTSGLQAISRGQLMTVEESAATGRLFLADFDNNAGQDLGFASAEGMQISLAGDQGARQPLEGPFPYEVMDAADVSGDGRLDLVGLGSAGEVVIGQNLGTKPYHWQLLRPKAAEALGDQRINSFGLGGEIEIRSGLRVQKRPITGPVVHFGMGEYLLADVARIIWPNGDVQAEFDLASDVTVETQQRLKGSCPWLFAWNGEEMDFVTDFIWRSPLGLRINAVETAGTVTTEDWVKIRGDQLKARDGVYDVRITAELWETHFFDHVRLLAVDHPIGTEIFVDERFGFPPPEMAVRVVETLRPVAMVKDQSGKDVSGVIASRDEYYLAAFKKGSYQGLAEPHYIDVVLPPNVPDGALLVAHGWVRPTDSSINVAASQAGHPKPSGIILHAKMADGSWRPVTGDLGFPSGKTKTILLDLDPVLASSEVAEVRIATNLEIYWDSIHWTVRSDGEVQIGESWPESVELWHRGYSEVRTADERSPEIPEYDRIVARGQIWRDLEGYHTRFGPVEELLESVDDRYVIMNAGDEMAFRFPEVPAVEGMVRDYVLVGDGWVKDGDYNTTASRTVGPLPSHAYPSYSGDWDGLASDPVYRRHHEDWSTYHTRFVTPESFVGRLLEPRGKKKYP